MQCSRGSWGGSSAAKQRHGSMHVHKERPIGLINLVQGTEVQVIVGVIPPEATVVVEAWAHIFSARDRFLETGSWVLDR